MGKISEYFEIKIWIRHGDEFSPVFFNCALQKVIDKWCKEKSAQKLEQSIKLGRTNIKAEFLIFADALAILTRDILTAQKQVELPKETTEK